MLTTSSSLPASNLLRRRILTRIVDVLKSTQNNTQIYQQLKVKDYTDQEICEALGVPLEQLVTKVEAVVNQDLPAAEDLARADEHRVGKEILAELPYSPSRALTEPLSNTASPQSGFSTRVSSSEDENGPEREEDVASSLKDGADSDTDSEWELDSDIVDVAAELSNDKSLASKAQSLTDEQAAVEGDETEVKEKVEATLTQEPQPSLAMGLVVQSKEAKPADAIDVTFAKSQTLSTQPILVQPVLPPPLTINMALIGHKRLASIAEDGPTLRFGNDEEPSSIAGKGTHEPSTPLTAGSPPFKGLGDSLASPKTPSTPGTPSYSGRLRQLQDEIEKSARDIYVEESADVETEAFKTLSAIHLFLQSVAKKDHRLTTDLLQSIDVNFALEEAQGASLLWLLAKRKHWDLVYLAMCHHLDANVNLAPTSGDDKDLPILFMAIKDWHLPNQFRNIRLLLERGAYTDYKYKDHQAHQYAYSLGLKEQHKRIYTLLDNYKNLFVISMLGVKTIFPQATSGSDTLKAICYGDAINLNPDEGASFLAVTMDGNTPLHNICSGNDHSLYNSTMLFLQSALSPMFLKQLLTKKNNNNQTPLDCIYLMASKSRISESLQTVMQEAEQLINTRLQTMVPNILQQECGRFVAKQFTAQNSGIAVDMTALKQAFKSTQLSIINETNKKIIDEKANAMINVMIPLIDAFIKEKFTGRIDILPKNIVHSMAKKDGLTFAETEAAKKLIEDFIWKRYKIWYQNHRSSLQYTQSARKTLLPSFQVVAQQQQQQLSPSTHTRHLSLPGSGQKRL